MTDLESIRRRLDALRRMTVENGCTEAEALAAAVKMAELLARHGMTEAQLEALGFDQAAVRIGARRDPLEGVWMSVARFADCIAWLSQGATGRSVIYFGREQDVLVAQYVHDVLHRAHAADLARFRASPQYGRRRLAKTRRQAVRAFTEGWAKEVAGKVMEGLWRRRGYPASGFLADLRAQEEKLSAAATERGVNLKPCRALAQAKGDARRDRDVGRAAGAQVQVNAGVGGAQAAGLLK